MRTTRLLALGVVISVFFCSRPGMALFFRGTRPSRASRSAISANSGFSITRRFFFFPGRAGFRRRDAGGISAGPAPGAQ